MEKHNYVKNIILILAIVLVSLLPIYYMQIDDYFSGDEVITYSMANNDKAGFVFSDGKISNYFKNEVFTGDISSILNNLMDMAFDVFQNRGSSRLLSYDRDPEVYLYSSEEMTDWFQKRYDERFDFFDTWIHSLSDDGNAWLYECLVNLSSSLFVRLSATKWAAFIVNYIFFLLTLYNIWRIGLKLGNEKFKNGLLLIGYCLWQETIGSVTNLRAYTVACFFSTLLGLLAIRIHSLIMDDRKPGLAIIAEFVVVYAFGFVAHYTIGAVLATYGLILLFLMLFAHKKYYTPIIVAGVVSLVAGIALAPDSIVGLIYEYSNKGASPLPGFMYPYIVALFVLLTVLIVALIRNRELVASSLYFMVLSTLLCLLMIMYGTNGIGYARIAYPLFYIIVASCVFKIAEHIHYKHTNMLIIAALVVFAIYNLYSVYARKMSQNNEIYVKRDALEGLEISECIYFRQHARGYKDTILLKDYFEHVQVITVDTADWEHLVEFDGAADRIVCYFTDESENKENLDWIRNLGYSDFEVIFSNNDTDIYFVSK